LAGVAQATPVTTFNVLLDGSASVTVEQTGENTVIALDSVSATINTDTNQLLELRIEIASDTILVGGNLVPFTAGLLVSTAPTDLVPTGLEPDEWTIFPPMAVEVSATAGGQDFGPSPGTTTGLVRLLNGQMVFQLTDIGGYEVKANIDFTAAIPEPTGFVVFGIGAMVAAAGAVATRRREANA
jgi:hypothetical protein